MFDLFKLHQPIDVGPKSWICFRGKDLKGKVEFAIKRKNLTFKRAAELLAESLNCGTAPFKEVFYAGNEWIPLPALEILVERKIISKKDVLDNTEEIKVNSAKSKPVKAVKELSMDFARIAGAHAADGNIHLRIGFQGAEKEMKKIVEPRIIGGHYRFRTADYKKAVELMDKINPKKIRVWQEYNIDLTDENRLSVLKYKSWFKGVFGVDLPKPSRFKNAWRINFSNKIIARYMMTFLGFPAGKKSVSVREPNIIRKSAHDMRIAFLQGVLSFDGSVNKRGNLYLTIKSKSLINSVNQIISRRGLNPRIYHDIKRERWTLSLIKEESKQCLDMFVEDTEKWTKLKMLHGL